MILGLVRSNIGACTNAECNGILSWEDGQQFNFYDMSPTLSQISVLDGVDHFYLSSDGTSISSIGGSESVALYCSKTCQDLVLEEEYCYEVWNHVPDVPTIDGNSGQTFCSDRGMVKPLVNTPERFYSFMKWFHDTEGHTKRWKI